MTRDDGLDPILEPWMARAAPSAPDDLLLRVMREVDTMSQRTQAMPSFLAASHMGAWASGVAVVAVLAVAVGLYFASQPGNVFGGPNATPSPTAAPTATVKPTPRPDLPPPKSIDAAMSANLTLWQGGNPDAVYSLYIEGAAVRIALDGATWTEVYLGREAIAATIVERGTMMKPMRTGPVISTGPYRAQTVTWAGGEGIAVYDFNVENRMAMHWVLGRGADRPGTGALAPASVEQFLDRCNTVMGKGDATAFAACFDQTASPELLIGVANVSGDWAERYSGTNIGSYAAIAQAEKLAVRRSGNVIAQGDFVAYAFDYTAADGNGSGIAVFRMTADHSKIIFQWVFGG